jgi:hypothetical protein
MGKDIDELASYFKPIALQLIQNCVAAGITVAIIDTGRTPAEQSVKIQQGVSWTLMSKHEPQPPEMKSEAIDIAPVSLLPTKLWSPNSPLWDQLGVIGKKLGLRWGGDWPKPKRDPSHFEYIHQHSNYETSTST